MSSTKDIKLRKDTTAQQPFSIEIENLTPNTTYYYCAIISDKNNIAYGGGRIVEKFKTNPLHTTVTVENAKRITSTSATLSGSYSSGKTVKTYFKYKEEPKKAPLIFLSLIL